LVGVKGLVIGADYDEAMIAEAWQRVEQAGLNTCVRHQRVDAMSLTFATD